VLSDHLESEPLDEAQVVRGDDEVDVRPRPTERIVGLVEQRVLDTGAVELREEGAQHISRFRTHAVAYPVVTPHVLPLPKTELAGGRCPERPETIVGDRTSSCTPIGLHGGWSRGGLLFVTARRLPDGDGDLRAAAGGGRGEGKL
jgi:hypothetical protein